MHIRMPEKVVGTDDFIECAALGADNRHAIAGAKNKTGKAS